jgi:hypothetical protein
MPPKDGDEGDVSGNGAPLSTSANSRVFSRDKAGND